MISRDPRPPSAFKALGEADLYQIEHAIVIPRDSHSGIRSRSRR